MRTVEVTYKGEENEDFSVIIERRRAVDLPWELAGRAVQKPGQKTYLLEANERLVIETFGAEVEMVFDKEQNAVMPRSAFESQPDAATKQQTEDDRQKEVKDQQFGMTRNEAVASQAADRERDRVLEEQMLRDKSRKEEELAKKEGAERETKTQKRPDLVPKPPAAPTPNVTTRPTPGNSTVGSSNIGGAGGGGMTAPGPSTGGLSSKDVK